MLDASPTVMGRNVSLTSVVGVVQGRFSHLCEPILSLERKGPG